MVEIPLSPALRRLIEAQVAARMAPEFEAKNEAKLAATKRAAIVAVLEARAVALDGPARERLDAATDEATLDRWLRRAATAATAAEALD